MFSLAPLFCSEPRGGRVGGTWEQAPCAYDLLILQIVIDMPGPVLGLEAAAEHRQVQIPVLWGLTHLRWCRAEGDLA